MDSKLPSKEDLKAYLCDSIDSLGLDETTKVISELLLSVAHNEEQDIEIKMEGIGSVKVKLDLEGRDLNG